MWLMDIEISGEIFGICRENRFLCINKELFYNYFDKNINGNGLKNYINSLIMEGMCVFKMVYFDCVVCYIGCVLKFGKLEVNLMMI